MSEFQDRVERLTAARQSKGTDKETVIPPSPLEQLQAEVEARRLARADAIARQQESDQPVARFGSLAERLEVLNQARSQQAN